MLQLLLSLFLAFLLALFFAPAPTLSFSLHMNDPFDVRSPQGGKEAASPSLAVDIVRAVEQVKFWAQRPKRRYAPEQREEQRATKMLRPSQRAVEEVNFVPETDDEEVRPVAAPAASSPAAASKSSLFTSTSQGT